MEWSQIAGLGVVAGGIRECLVLLGRHPSPHVAFVLVLKQRLNVYSRVVSKAWGCSPLGARCKFASEAAS